MYISRKLAKEAIHKKEYDSGVQNDTHIFFGDTRKSVCDKIVNSQSSALKGRVGKW